MEACASPPPAHLETPQIMEESMAVEERRMIDEAIAASLAEVNRREMGVEVPERLFDSLSHAHRAHVASRIHERGLCVFTLVLSPEAADEQPRLKGTGHLSAAPAWLRHARSVRRRQVHKPLASARFPGSGTLASTSVRSGQQPQRQHRRIARLHRAPGACMQTRS